MQERLILSKLLDYFKLKDIKYKKTGKIIMLNCPYCNKDMMSAQIIPNTHIVNCHNCHKKYNLIELASLLEKDFPTDKEEQLHYLKKLLKLKITTSKDEEEINKILDFYQERKWGLIPIAKGTKIPIKGSKWRDEEHKDKKEWENWIYNATLNIGLPTGSKNNILAIDVDVLTKAEKEEYRNTETKEARKKEILNLRKERLEAVNKAIGDKKGNPLIQVTLGGEHWIYEYDKDVPKTYFDLDNIHYDIESEGGYILIFPSKVNDERAFLNNILPSKLPEGLKKLILENAKTTKPKEEEEEPNLILKPGDMVLKNNNLEGCCNNSFVALGGILRKQLNKDQTKYVLHVLNKHLLENPMESKVIESMVYQLDKYSKFEEQDLADKMLHHLKLAKSATKAELEFAVLSERAKGANKTRFDKALMYLIINEDIVRKGREYFIIERMDWQDDLLELGTPINYAMPFFNDYAYFNQKDLILILSKTQYGKTHLAMNIIKRLVDQGIKPYYAYNESGARFAKIAFYLGLKNGDFKSAFCSNPDNLILEKNAITIYDWVKPKDFSRTDSLYAEFVEKLEKAGGNLICFAQLRKNNEAFAPDQIEQYPAFVAKYLYEKEDEGTNTKFVITKVRDGKMRGKQFEIPCEYNWETKEVKRIDELEGNK